MSEADDTSPSPLAFITKGIASALESVLEMAFPGQVQLFEEAEAALRTYERSAELLGEDVSIGWTSKEPMKLNGGMQIEAECSGSRGSGTVLLGASKNTDCDDAGNIVGPVYKLEILVLTVGEEELYVVEP